MVNIEKKDRFEVVTFMTDNINALVSDDIREKINRVFDNSNSRVIIDLTGVNYIDSTGFSCFLTLMRSARNSYSTMKFANPEPSVLDLLRALHLHTVFQIYDDMDSCLRSFS